MDHSLEQPLDNSINFLLSLHKNVIFTSWYQENTELGRYLNVISYGPIQYKMSLKKSLLDRVSFL